MNHYSLHLIAAFCAWLAAAPLAAARPDSVVLGRVFSFQQRYAQAGVEGFETNVYVKHVYQTLRRNAGLGAVPSMHAIARGERSFVSEEYGRFIFHDVNHYENRCQVSYSTIPRHSHPMDVLTAFLTPRLYDAALYGDHILSPFCRDNRVFYRYRVSHLAGGMARLSFRPRFVNNTQLVSGEALVEVGTGRISQVEMEGEFDMLRFHTLSVQGGSGARALLPRMNRTDVDFRFMGNHTHTHFEALFDCPVTLPDSTYVRGDRQLIDSVRPVPLTAEEQAIYAYYDSIHPPRRPALPDTLGEEPAPPRRHDRLKEIGWDLIGERLIRSMKAQTENASVRLSPIINPQYFSYSRRKGFSYKLKLGAQYRFSEHTSLRFNPTLGYNFKLRKLFFNAPLRLNFAPKHEGHADIVWGNGNRIGNSSVAKEIRRDLGLAESDTLPGEEHLVQFDDLHLRVLAGGRLTSWLMAETGLTFHHRKAVNGAAMAQYGKPTEYRSLAPLLSLKLRPWRHAPLFSIDYERGLKLRSTDLAYERWEADASLKHRMRRMQTLNVRIGGGVYTRKDENYFMDFANFRDENLPEGWDDDWTGNFQLLSSGLYNSSRYYVRSNVSYESPLLLASMVPLVGRYVERERAYVSTLLIVHTRLYSEVGYGFTCRFFSVGFFTSFYALKFSETGCKFTFELFRRW